MEKTATIATTAAPAAATTITPVQYVNPQSLYAAKHRQSIVSYSCAAPIQLTVKIVTVM